MDKKELAEKCMNEIKVILERHQCDIICAPGKYYGQQVFIPMIEYIGDMKDKVIVPSTES